jgi:hypothetical protein
MAGLLYVGFAGTKAAVISEAAADFCRFPTSKEGNYPIPQNPIGLQ